MRRSAVRTPWPTAHPEKEKVIIGDLNFDTNSDRAEPQLLSPPRTPDTFPSYTINDIAQGMMEWVSHAARERVRYCSSAKPDIPVAAPTGSKDAFYIKIDKH